MKNKKLFGFSLAEMMIVLMIVALVMAATAPMITRKVSRERSDKIFDILNTDPANAVEYVKGRNQRLFMNARNNGYVGIRESGDTIPNNSVLFGYNILANNANSLIGIGFNTTNGINSVSIGNGAIAGKRSVAIGTNAKTENPNLLNPTTMSPASNSVAIGYNARAVSQATAIGYGARANNSYSVVLGTEKDTVYIPGNLIVGKSTFVGAQAVSDGKRYPFYAHARFGHDGDGRHIVDMINVIEANHGKDYKGGGDFAMAMLDRNIPGVRLGFYEFQTDSKWRSRYDDNQKMCPPRNNSGNWNRISNGRCATPTETGTDSLFFSDIRLKDVGEAFTGGLEELSKLNFYHFTFKKDKAKTPQVGVMAQDLQKVFPDAVVTADTGYLKIRWDEMFFAVINAVKELNTKIIALTDKLQVVTTDVETLKSTVEKQQLIIDEQDKVITTQKTELENLSARVEKLEKRKK